MDSSQEHRQISDDNKFLNEDHKNRQRIIRIVGLIFLVVLIIFAAAFVVVERHPSLGAKMANQMRKIAGPQAVAHVESLIFKVQDTLKYGMYQSGISQAEAPWISETPAQERSTVSLISTNNSLPCLETEAPLEVPPAAQKTPLYIDRTVQATPLASTKISSATPTPTPYSWHLPDLMPIGTLEGEGKWQAYLHDRSGNVVAMRTFLQPDPQRPYAIVAVVAFDLNQTRLNFVLGFLEPSLPGGPKGDGLIPEADRVAGKLLATFNGGFRSANGQFGAMADGIITLAPKEEIATVAIYHDGEVRIGNWGEDILDSPDMAAWRQNCRLIIQDGQISPRVYNNSITDWGASINNEIVTRRSGMGLDRENDTLYYFAGPGLSMPVLADAMLATGVHQGMLLDINNFWVMFSAIRPAGDELIAEPLLPNEMKDKVDRYLGPSPDDFFYITLMDNQ